MSNTKDYDESRWFEHGYAVSIQAFKTTTDATIAEHAIISVTGSTIDSEERAGEIALQSARAFWPKSDGWSRHNFHCMKLKPLTGSEDNAHKVIISES